MAQNLTEMHIWQMLELVASPDCEVDTELLSAALDKVVNGTACDREDGIQEMCTILSDFLPDFGRA